MKYWVIASAEMDDGAFLVSLPEEGPEHFKYSEGVSLASEYSQKSEAIMLFDPDYEDQTELYDLVENTDSALVVTSKVKGIIETVQSEGVEFLPVTLWDHDRKPVDAGYYIVNCLGSFPIIDTDKSDIVMSSLSEDQIFEIKELAINESFDSGGVHIFRASAKLDQHFISEELKGLFEEEGVTGAYILEANGWDGYVF